MDGVVPIFELLLYEKYIPHKYLSTFVRYFQKTDDDNVFFRKRKALSSQYQ